MRPFSIKDGLHRDPALSVVIEKQGSDYYFAVNPIRPATPTILNEAIADDNWHAVATGLTDVLGWRLSERSGQDFYFAFTAAPATYATGFGWIGDQTSITSIYAKRKGTTNLTMELLYWKI